MSPLQSCVRVARVAINTISGSRKSIAYSHRSFEQNGGEAESSGRGPRAVDLVSIATSYFEVAEKKASGSAAGAAAATAAAGGGLPNASSKVASVSSEVALGAGAVAVAALGAAKPTGAAAAEVEAAADAVELVVEDCV